ncbi:MAG: hypothetical protein GKR88_09175 [Flavobacteriaceae bacterium]|nr:MAG: hypothetical protein GKR88_09175 [Flavobacteriaceae bacterium]
MTYILEYAPSQEYLSGASQYYSGTVAISQNDLFDTDDLISSRLGDCVVGVHTAWECSFGNPHAPGTCNATSFEFVFTVIWGECSSGTEDNYINPPSGGGGGLGGGSSGGDDDSEDNEVETTLVDPRCSGEKIMDADGNCVCPPGKVEDSSGSCVCRAGYTENINGLGTCVKKPCAGDPVPDPEIAPQYGPSGTQGAMFGNPSSGGCKRYGGNDCNTPRNKKHGGIDLKNEQGAPIFAMYDGYIYSTKYHKEAGYYTRIHSTVNGKNILIFIYKKIIEYYKQVAL